MPEANTMSGSSAAICSTSGAIMSNCGSSSSPSTYKGDCVSTPTSLPVRPSASTTCVIDGASETMDSISGGHGDGVAGAVFRRGFGERGAGQRQRQRDERAEELGEVLHVESFPSIKFRELFQNAQAPRSPTAARRTSASNIQSDWQHRPRSGGVSCAGGRGRILTWSAEGKRLAPARLLGRMSNGCALARGPSFALHSSGSVGESHPSSCGGQPPRLAHLFCSVPNGLCPSDDSIAANFRRVKRVLGKIEAIRVHFASFLRENFRPPVLAAMMSSASSACAMACQSSPAQKTIAQYSRKAVKLK